MDSPRLSVLDEYGDVIEPLFEEELNLTWKHAALEFLLRSALQYGHAISFWFTIAQRNDVKGEAIVLEGLQSDAFRARAAAVTALGRLGVQFIPDLSNMLADDYPQVRMAAITALERLQPSGEWRMHLKYECFVPEGEYIMGNGEVAHKIYLEAFYIGRYPVTKSEYKRYCEDVNQPYDVPEGKERHPVVEVTWYDARNYATWAGMRLLSEAEWEKAASWDIAGRGEKRLYPWGDEFDKTKCNTAKSGVKTTTPVGRFSPHGDSPYGCADMAGNVWEWCSSKFEKYPYQKDDGREEMSGYDLRVRRGGSFDRNASHAACAYRLHLSPLNRTSRDGFRVGADVPAALDFEL